MEKQAHHGYIAFHFLFFSAKIKMITFWFVINIVNDNQQNTEKNNSYSTTRNWIILLKFQDNFKAFINCQQAKD